MPACDALVFPSTHPEAFGMVAAEAASAGVLPVSAAHSGALEVSRELADRPARRGSRPRLVHALGQGAIESIAARLNIWLNLEPHDSARPADRSRETAKRLWGWEGVAQEVIEASMTEPS